MARIAAARPRIHVSTPAMTRISHNRMPKAMGVVSDSTAMGVVSDSTAMGVVSDSTAMGVVSDSTAMGGCQR